MPEICSGVFDRIRRRHSSFDSWTNGLAVKQHCAATVDDGSVHAIRWECGVPVGIESWRNVTVVADIAAADRAVIGSPNMTRPNTAPDNINVA